MEVQLKNEFGENIYPNSVPDYNKICKSVCRIGDGRNTPIQTLHSYQEAYEQGFRAMLCDVRFTSDNIAICDHDERINGYYQHVKNPDGTWVTNTTPFTNLTISQINEYDFGLYKGEQYRGTKILTVEKFTEFCKKRGCEMYLELKTSLTTAQAEQLIDIVKSYGMWSKCTFSPQTPTAMDVIVDIEPNVYINQHSNIGTGTLSVTDINQLATYINDYNRGHVTITASDTGSISTAAFALMKEYEIKLMATTLDTEEQVRNYYNRGYPYSAFEEVLTNTIIAGKVLFEMNL